MENPGLYDNLLQDAGDASTEKIVTFLKVELPGYKAIITVVIASLSETFHHTNRAVEYIMDGRS